VLVHAKADLAAGATATLRLRKAGAVSGTPMAVVDDTTGITVDTGVIRVEVSRQHATVLDSLVRDGVELLDPADADHGLLVTDRSGQVLRSADAEVLSTEVERTGPLTTTVHQLIEMDDVRLRDEHRETWGTNACFDWLYSCSELQRYRLRVDVWSEFTAGSDDVRLRARVANASVCPVTEDGVKHCAVPGSLNSIGWEDLTIRLGSARVLGSATTGGATAPVGSGSLVSHQESSGLDSWAYYTQLAPIGSNGYDPGGWEERLGSHVAYRGYRTSAAGTVLDSGDRAPGWLTASAGTGPALGIVTPDPWKRYPIALRADSGGVELGWYPGEFAAQYSMRPGERHTVELAVVADAGGGASSRTALRALADPIRWSIDPADLAASGALPRLAPVGEDAGYDTWNMASVDRSISQAHHPQPSDASSVLWARDRFNMWGKLEAGYLPNDNEARTSTDLSKYGQYQGFLLQSLRGDGGPTWADVWWEMAVDANRAQADSGYLITPTADPGSLWPGIDMAHCFHENAENVTYPRGGGFGCDFAGDLGGMVLHHHMTGWEPDRDAIDAHLRLGRRPRPPPGRQRPGGPHVDRRRGSLPRLPLSGRHRQHQRALRGMAAGLPGPPGGCVGGRPGHGIARVRGGALRARPPRRLDGRRRGVRHDRGRHPGGRHAVLLVPRREVGQPCPGHDRLRADDGGRARRRLRAHRDGPVPHGGRTALRRGDPLPVRHRVDAVRVLHHQRGREVRHLRGSVPAGSVGPVPALNG
jgi:hypothetical protein